MDVINPNRRLEFSAKASKMSELKKQIKESTDFLEKKRLKEENLEMSKENIPTVFAYLLYIVQLVLGITMSSQWVLFFVLFLIGIVVYLIKKAIDNIHFQKAIIAIDSTICACILTYIILNHFHHFNYLPLGLTEFIEFIF